MPSYFGCQSNNYSDQYPDTQIYWNDPTYVCPGSGNQAVQELSVSLNTYVNGVIRLGIYSSGNALMAEGIAAVTPGGTGWQGHMNQASVKNAGGVSPGVLVGGAPYRLAVTQSTANMTVRVINSGANNMHYILTDYTGGMPATLIGGTAWNYEVTMRCGVDPYGGGGPDISQKRIVCCS